MIPIGTDYRMTRTPWVNYALVASNVVIFLMYHYRWPAAFGSPDAYLLHPDAPLIYQFFTSVFMHAGWMHLLGNMVFLWVFGNALNDRLGQAGYLAFYLAGGVLADVGYVLLSGAAPVLGASGAICAVTGAYLVLLPRIRVKLVAWLFYMPIFFELSSLVFLAFQFVVNIVNTMPDANMGGGVAYAAHSAGYVFGILVAVGLLATRILPRDPYDLLSLIHHRNRRTRFQHLVAKGYDPFNPVGGAIGAGGSRPVETRTVEAVPADGPVSRELQLRRQISDACASYDMPQAASLYLSLLSTSPEAVLPQAQQLDVANQLMAEERYSTAAEAYERLLTQYPRFEHSADIHLMLGMIYGRYLHETGPAEKELQQAIATLRDPNKVSLAQSDLNALGKRG